MEVQLRSYYRPGRSFNTLPNPSSKFKGNRNKKNRLQPQNQVGKISEGLECTDYLCFSSNLRYKALPGRGVPVPLPPPPPQIKIILLKKTENLFSYVMVFPNIAFVRYPNLSNFPFCSPIPMNFSPVPLPWRTLVSHIQIVIDHPGISLRVCGVGSRPN